MISSSFQEVLILLKNSITCQRKVEIMVDDWDRLFQELKCQTVQAVPAAILLNILPVKEQNCFIRILAQHHRIFHMQLLAQDSLVRLYNEKNISFVILKGLAVARYYPQPKYRSLGDIDIAVLHDQYDYARKVLLQDGYCEIENPYEKHSVFKKNNVTFELHKYFASTNDIEKATYIENTIQQGILSPVICKLENHCFPVLPAMADGLMLLEHMSQHLEEGIGLRHILDWMVYASHELSDEKWNSEFKKLAETAGLRRLAEVLTKLCKNFLGMEGVTWCDSVDDEICDRLLVHIEERGNFGNKATSSFDKAQKIISIYKGPSYWFRYLQRTGLRIPFIQKHRFLSPFAWLVRGCTLAFQYLKDRDSIFIDFNHAQKMAKEIDLFLDDLDVRRLSRGHTYWNGKSFILKK